LIHVIPTDSSYLKKLGFSLRDIAKAIYDLDQQEFPDFICPFDTYENAIRDERQIWILLFDKEKKKIVGYFGLQGFDEKGYLSMIDGSLKDENFNDFARAIEGECYIYIMSIAIEKEYRHGSTNFKKLLGSALEKLIEYVKSGVIIRSMVTRGLTKSGKEICEAAGLTKVGSHQEKGVIYEANFENYDHTPRMMKPLFNAIQKLRIDRLRQELDSLGEAKGLPVILETLKNWGYKVDGL
jgi:hypothetical protein